MRLPAATAFCAGGAPARVKFSTSRIAPVSPTEIGSIAVSISHLSAVTALRR